MSFYVRFYFNNINIYLLNNLIYKNKPVGFKVVGTFDTVNKTIRSNYSSNF